MLSSGKIFGLSEKNFGLSEKYCPWPPQKHGSHGATDVDLYDEQQFTCPTSKITSNLLDGYLRQNNERNENIFRRKWTGTRNDLINKIRNGSINSFCDPARSGMDNKI